ncbi:MAG TPA: ATP-binding cassette domain-containing protein [Candidatus Onthoplasma faecipullorum]|nr:ATP-binding cassette domain-containing protein [Candidatus Onthoplasma faecipullorum]
MIELNNITYIVEDKGIKKTILDNISIKFEDNCVTAITGQNGSGKSTLTKIIIGIIKPTSGQILYNGVDITNYTIDERVKLGINYAFQQPITFKGMTVKELIDIASNQNNSIPKACEYLSRVGICAKDYIERDFDKTLSGGEQKRIELAIALAQNGNTVIFDEPEAGIDIWSFERLSKIFEKNKSYIVVSHQTKFLSSADKIIVMENGRVTQYGPAKDILKNLKRITCKKVEE